MSSHIIFLFNLLQDVGVARPLVYLAAAEFSDRLSFLVSTAFLKRDRSGTWIAELNEMARQLGARVEIYDSPFAAHAYLQGKRGVIIAASESDLAAHGQTHAVFRSAPSGFVKITLQHGFECVGFLQNEEQTQVHGTNVGFAADVICGWCDADMLRSIAPSELPKLYVSGPPMAMRAGTRLPLDAPSPRAGGIVCENLHSVRFSTAAERRTLFVEQFLAFAAVMGWREEALSLRPHPGGQYLVRNAMPLADHVTMENRPLYQLDLAAFDFAISAPSTILFDMMIAGVPIAIWNDPGSPIDASNYDGLRRLTTFDDWLQFQSEATNDPASLRSQQAAFLDRTKMILDPGEVQTRFARLLAGAGSRIAPRTQDRPVRILFLVNAVIPSFTISFLHPLSALHEAGRVEIIIITEADFVRGFAVPDGDDVAGWIASELAGHRPDIIVACRYSGPNAQAITDAAQANGIPLVYHLDDDLLNIPPEIGEKKYRLHNAPERLASVRTFLDRADLIYASTPALRDRIVDLGFTRPVVSGTIYCADEVRRPPARRLRGTFGYMGGRDHAPDLETIVPAIAAILDRHPDLAFEIFGGIPMPADLDRFGARVRTIPPVDGYDAFRERFASVDWDVGLCPLAPSSFNRCKADTKWVDYTAVGMAVIATGGMGYDRACADGCGILATTRDEWVAAIELLCGDADIRFEQVRAAQDKLTRDYAPERLTTQLLGVLATAGLDTKTLVLP